MSTKLNILQVPATCRLMILIDYIYGIDRTGVYYMHYASGYRSMIFSSILRSRGYDHVININGGLTTLKVSGGFKIEKT